MADGHDTGAEPNIELPQLRVWATVGEAYAVWFANLGLWLKLSIIPVIIVAVLGGLVSATFPDPSTPQTQGLFLPMFLIFMFTVGIYLSEIPLATAWHRFILVREETESHRYLVGRREWRYLLKALYIVLIVALVSIVVGLLLGLLLIPFGMALMVDGASAGNLTILGVVSAALSLGIYALLGYIVGYLLLMLPAAAIGRSYSATEASAAIEGNEWRLVGVYVVTFLPLFVLDTLIDLSSGPAHDAVSSVVEVVTYIVWILFAPLIVGVLSITYRELVQKLEAVGETPA